MADRRETVEAREREAFEKWYSDDGAYPRAVERGPNGFYRLAAGAAWNVWQARAALEGQQSRPVSADAHPPLQRVTGVMTSPDVASATRRLAAEGVDRIALIALSEANNREAWDALTFESGPYSINRVKHWATDYTREVIRAALSSQAEPQDRAEREAQIFRAERDQARAERDRAVRILAAIHIRIYPKLVTLEDGRTFKFTAPDPHVYLQALGDEIRAIPDEIATQLPEPSRPAAAPQSAQAGCNHFPGQSACEWCGAPQ